MHFPTRISRCTFYLPLVLLACLAFCGVAKPQELDLPALDKLDREITNLLLQKDIGTVANELVTENAGTVTPLLRNLIIYSRAGHREGVRQTLERLAEAPDWRPYAEYYSGNATAVRFRVRSTTTDDLAAARIYYERLCPHDAEGTEAFVRLWDKQGDPKELDLWLAAHAADNDEWFKLRMYRRGKQGTAGELLDALAAEVKANPNDRKRVERYLVGNNWAGNPQNVAWLADVFPMGTAYEYFEFGRRLQPYSPEVAARLFEKSLTLPFTEMDAKRVEEPLRFRQIAITPANWNREKQLRYWTKASLAETYQALKRSGDAQPIIEDLVKIRTDDIIPEDLNQLAGSVQAGSGGRFVEAKILRDETERRKTSQYWLERAQYYRGRGEYGLERDTYKQALVALPFSSQDEKAWRERFWIVRSFAHFLGDRSDKPEGWRQELEALLGGEFARVQPEHPYAFEIAELITQNEFALDEFRGSLLRKQPDLLVRLLSSRSEWGGSEQALIEAFVNGESITRDEKEGAFSQLEKLVKDPASNNAYYLASAMLSAGAHQRAIPLLLAHLEHTGDHRALLGLVSAYSRVGDWQAAEKALFAHKDIPGIRLPAELGNIAVTAANQGATDQALRFWRMKARLNRNDLDGLEWLARTKAKALLQEFYVQMKKDDPQSSTPDAALQLLR